MMHNQMCDAEHGVGPCNCPNGRSARMEAMTPQPAQHEAANSTDYAQGAAIGYHAGYAAGFARARNMAVKECEAYAEKLRRMKNPKYSEYAELPASGADHCAQIIRSIVQPEGD